MDLETINLTNPHQQHQDMYAPMSFIPLTSTMEDNSFITPTTELLIMTPRENLISPQEFDLEPPRNQNHRFLSPRCQRDLNLPNEIPTIIQQSPSTENLDLSLDDEESFFLMTPDGKNVNLNVDNVNTNSSIKFRLQKRSKAPQEESMICGTRHISRPIPRSMPRHFDGHSSVARSSRQLDKADSDNQNNQDSFHDLSSDNLTSTRHSIVQDSPNNQLLSLVKSARSFKPIQDDED